MTGKEMVKKMLKDGWTLDRVNGSHHIMVKDGISIPVPVHAGKDLRPGTLQSILKQAGYK
jgi:predicted RNA binding protein YcfA (HicA-like mRNA interferase family)